MLESLADIEALTLRCRSERSKEHIAEAVTCYRAGAYRAAIVSTWIAVVFDLVDKIRELAAAGAPNAQAIDKKYEGHLEQIEAGNDIGLKGALEFERTILETSRDNLQFIDKYQFDDLTRLREDRHRCAHPSFQRIGEPYRPCAEQARLHLRNAVVHVLAEPPIQGKAAMSRIKALVLSPYFPEEIEKAAVQLRASPLGKPTDSLISAFIDTLVFGFIDKNSDFYGKTAVWPALNAAMQMFPDKAERRIKQQINKAVRDVEDASLSFAISLAAHITSGWSLLDQDAKDKVVSFVEHGPIAEMLAGLRMLSEIPGLQAAAQARIDVLDYEDLAKGIGDHGLGVLAKKRAIEYLGQSYSFDRVNEVINRVIFPIFDQLDKADFERIIKLPIETRADLPGARGYTALIEKLRTRGLFEEAELNALLKANRGGLLIPQPQV